MARFGRVDAAAAGDILADVLIPAETIKARLAELAAQIAEDYAGRDLLLVGVLKGAMMVMADLSRALPFSVEVDWMAISSYGSGTRSSGVVRIPEGPRRRRLRPGTCWSSRTSSTPV